MGSFKSFISDSKKNQIALMVEGQNFVLFFKYRDEIFGAYEQHRITFAKMKNPDEETTPGWLQESNFMAFNLTKALSGQVTQQVFKYKDMPEIKVIQDKDDVYNDLVKQAGNVSADCLKSTFQAAISKFERER